MNYKSQFLNKRDGFGIIVKIIALVFLFSSFSFAQTTQTIRGTVYDKESKSPLPGATVILLIDSAQPQGVSTDIDGHFKLEKVKLGRRTIKIMFTGYKEITVPNIVVDAGKESILTIEMEESIVKIEAVEISASGKSETNNEMSTVSARTFSVEESNRYAGSRSDPARMASNFAGVQGADDSRNDIVVRGNSPMGLLWRLNDIDIPSPNHFSTPGTTGSAVSVLNNKTLANSDFMTGAFPAEYGNSVAGVFDLKMRNGNNEKHEFTGQFGFLGTEIMAEGPISKSSGSSYMAAYRYSTLKLFETLKIPIGTTAVPNYQDAAFKLNFPLKNGGNLSFFGIGGSSNIAILVSNLTEPPTEIYGQKDRDQYFKTSMGVAGMSYSKSMNEKTYFRITIAGSGSTAGSEHNLVYRDSNYTLTSIIPKTRYTFIEGKISVAASLNKKFSAKSSMKIGLVAEQLYTDYTDSIYDERFSQQWLHRFGSVDFTYFARAYGQWKYKFTDNLTLITGLHTQYFALSKSFSLEPRAGLRWQVRPAHALSIGSGMHSQMQPLYIYYYHQISNQGKYVYHNQQLDFTKSVHVVGSYDYTISAYSRIKVETYYQYLYNIPVDRTRNSSFSLVNLGSVFSRYFPDSLKNTGTGRNIGLEFTYEKFFGKSYFLLLTASVFDSKYKGSDGIERNTDFNGSYAANILAGKEFKVGAEKNKTITTGIKITMAGGKRYGPADTTASRIAGEVIMTDATRNSLQYAGYFRLDAKLGYKINRKKTTHEIAVDLVNVLNRKNILGLTYAPDPRNPSVSPVREEYQLGFLPLFYYKVDF